MITSRWETATTVVVGALLGIGALWAISRGLVVPSLASWGDAGRSARLLHISLLIAAGAVWIAALSYLGPRARSSASLQWRTSSESPPRFWLRHLGATMLIALVVAVTLVAPTITSPHRGWAATGGFALVLVALGAAVYLAELIDATAWIDLCARLLAGAALSCVALSSRQTEVAVIFGGATLAWLVAHRAPLRFSESIPDEPPRWLLVRAAESRWALCAGVLTLDGTVVRQVRERLSGQPSGRPIRLPLATPPSLARVSILFLRQMPTIAPTILVTTYLATVLAGASSTSAGVSFLLVGLGWLGGITSRTCDRWAQAPSLRRSYAEISTPEVLMPALLATALLAACGVVALRPDPLHALMLMLVPPVLIWRRHMSRRGRASGWVVLPSGALSVSQVDALVGGWDVVLLALLLVDVL